MLTVKAKAKTAYSPIRHLAWALWLNHDPARCWMTMLAAYFDTSGHQDGDAPLVVTGLASTERRWLRFEREWQSMLQAFGVPYLHMKEYAHSRGPYESWRNDTTIRKHFLARATDIIAKNIAHVATHYIPLDDFREVDRTFHLGDFFHGAFALAAVGCALKMREWQHQKYPKQEMAYVVETGDTGQGTFIDLVRHLNIQVIPKPKVNESGKWFAPFQAADFIAYEVAKEWRTRETVRTGASRKSLIGVVKRVHPLIYYLPQDAIRDLVETFPAIFPRRTKENP